jgi:hypothetical protein
MKLWGPGPEKLASAARVKAATVLPPERSTVNCTGGMINFRTDLEARQAIHEGNARHLQA